MAAIGRPRRQVSMEQLKILHSQGYTDGKIAEMMNIPRSTVRRRREELELKPNRYVGERGPDRGNELPYHQTVRRMMKHVGHYVRDAAREHRKLIAEQSSEKESYEDDRFLPTMGIDPRDLPHLEPGPYCKRPERMNLTEAKYISDTEKMMDFSDMVGVPGPAILELASQYKSAKEDIIKDLAMQAVQGAGIVGTQMPTSLVAEKGTTPLADWKEAWEKREEIIKDFAPIKEESKPRMPRIPETNTSRSGTGKRGRGGGIQSINNHRAFEALKGN